MSAEPKAPDVFVCRGTGSLSAAARAAIDEFAAHLTHKHAGESVPTCRFCARRTSTGEKQ